MSLNFSQRMGLEPATRPFQKNSMDRALRTSLWNAYLLHCHETNEAFVRVLWIEFLKWPWPVDDISLLLNGYQKRLEEWILDPQKAPWNKVYEFVEFAADLKDRANPPPRVRRKKSPTASHAFIAACNDILERECSAYRFVGKILVPLTSEQEIEAVHKAASMDDDLLRPVSMHMQQAVKLLSDRKQPDYRNSMKESISAVEAICKIIAEKEKVTLGPALDAVLAKLDLHTSLHQGFKAIYGYTSDHHGIRHGLKDDAEPEAEDATLMLVMCSGFVNYLVEKARKKGLLAT